MQPSITNKASLVYLSLYYIIPGHIPTDDDKITQSPAGVLHATTNLLKNKAYIFNTLASICIVFFLYALGPFMIQIIMIKYGADPFKIVMPVMIVLLFGFAGWCRVFHCKKVNRPRDPGHFLRNCNYWGQVSMRAFSPHIN